MMDVTIDNNEPSDDFRGILSMIKKAGKVPVDELKGLGDYHPGLHDLEVDSYTIGTMFFRYQYRKREEVYKRVLAKSFIDHANIKLDTRMAERKFQEWGGVAFPRKGSYFKNDEKDHNQSEYHSRGNFVVECLFIIEVIRRFAIADESYTTDGLSSIKLLSKARRDLLVFDNQLPFYVLEALYDLAFPNSNPNFLSLCIKFFSECMLISDYSQASAIIEQLQQHKTSGSEIKDFIDLLRKCHTPMFPRQPPMDSIKFTAMRKAHYLGEARVAIRPASIDSTVCSLNYSKGVLKIPKLRISNMSRHLIGNLMEYEMQHYPQSTFIIDYVHFMDSLIDTTKDVDILIDNEILYHCLPNSREVASTFNNIVDEVPLIAQNYYYHGISEAVNDYCKIPRRRWKALLRCFVPRCHTSSISHHY